MIAALLLASWLPSQTWSWQPIPQAARYRIYWGASGKAWCSSKVVEYTSSVCTPTNCRGDIPMPDFTPAFIIVVSVSATGVEGATDHGNVVVCPARTNPVQVAELYGDAQ